MKQASSYHFPARFETERLILRPWRVEEAEVLYRYASDERVGPQAGWPVHVSVQDSASIIESVLTRVGSYAVTLKSTGEPIGSVALSSTDLGDDRRDLELGYWIAVPYWGNGYVVEASKALLEYGFETLDCPVIWCAANKVNEKSRRAQEKLGFQFDREWKGRAMPLIGTVEDDIITKITRADWDQTH